jgi:hypothetical protein
VLNKDEVTKKFGDQVRRSLAVERIKGFEFPDKCDVGVLVLSYTSTAYRVKARMDNISIEATIKMDSEAKDIMETVGHLVEPWLISYATKKP